VQRRQLIQAIPVSLAGALLPAEPAAPQSAAPAALPLQYGTFTGWLEAARAAALNLVKETGAKDTEQFMQFLALWATAMPEPAELTWQSIAGANEELEAAAVSPGRPFVVAALRMAPGCTVPLHCHPNGGAVSVCTQGSLVMRHYDLAVGSAAFTDIGATAEVDEASVASLTSNRFTLFTPTRANVHTFTAGPEGATLVEIAVQWGGTGEFSYLKLDDALAASTVRRHHGHWVGMDIARAYTASASR
jgi:hypothetical protein